MASARTLVECVPNFSEGRDLAKVDAIVEAIASAGASICIALPIPITIAR